MWATKLLFFCALSAMAQKSFITGVVTDEHGSPAHVEVNAFAGIQGEWSSTDHEGHYRLELSPGQYEVRALDTWTGYYTPRAVTLGAGQEVTVNFQAQGIPTVSGKVIDSEDRPLPDIQITLIAREFMMGRLRYIVISTARTDEKGFYKLNSPLHRTFLLMASVRPGPLAMIATNLPNQAKRKTVFIPTFYPGTSVIEAAQPVSVAIGESRDATNVRMLRSPEFCVSGAVKPAGERDAFRITVAPLEPSSEKLNGATIIPGSSYGLTQPGGAFQICGLGAGTYKYLVTASEDHSDRSLSSIGVFVLEKNDLDDLKISALPFTFLRTEISWKSPPLIPEPDARASIALPESSFSSGIPAILLHRSLLGAEKTVTASGYPAFVYAGDIEYDGLPVSTGGITIAGPGTLRVKMANDGGTIAVSVVDEENRPVSEAYITLLPADATTDQAIAARSIRGKTDQRGMWQSPTLPPIAWKAIATGRPLNNSPEDLLRVLGARLKAENVDLGPRQNASVQAKIQSLD